MAEVLDAQLATFTIADDEDAPVEVGQIKSFSGLDGEATDIDVSDLASEAKEFLQGLQVNGGFNLDLWFDPLDAGQAELIAARALQATRECVLTLVSGYTFTFDAYVKSLSSSGSVNNAISGTCTMMITGDIVIGDPV